MKYVVELNDDDGKNFQVEMHIPFVSTVTNIQNSSWKALDNGFIKYHSGGCVTKKKGGFAPTDLWLVTNGVTGVQFFALFDDLGSVNSSGKGMAQQPWVVCFKPGGFGWTLIS